jgi:peptidoglycan/xylan/chitin deacetylase (PgdA/CDA1 family)
MIVGFALHPAVPARDQADRLGASEMESHALQRRRTEQARARRQRRRRRLGGLGTLAVVAAAAAAIVLSAGSGSRTRTGAPVRAAVRGTTGRHHRRVASIIAHLGPATGHPGDARVPILTYHVINPPPAGAPYPGLYVPRAEFAAQMRSLRHAGWHAVTLDELRENRLHGNRLPSKPIVITFDNGYRSQYTHALPILRRMHWAAVENLQLTGLPPSQGGITTAQVRGLLKAGWELDTQGISHADLVELDPSRLRFEIDHARTVLRHRYRVPVRWFCYPSGQYDPAVVAAVRAAGFVGSTTVVPGWADPADSPYALPRLRVLGDTSPAALLTQIAGATDDGITPTSDTSSSP